MSSVKIACLAVALSFVAPAVRGEIGKSRAAFERPFRESFAGSTLVAADFASADVRYDKAKGRSGWKFALPSAKDWRLRFVEATFAGGRFVEGRLHVLGFGPVPLDAAAFEALRAEFPMVSVRTAFDDVAKTAVFYPARSVATVRRIASEHDAGDDPSAHFLGALSSSLERLGLSSEHLVYRVTVTSKAGVSVDCGVATAKAPLGAEAMSRAIRAGLEKADPSRRGQVSERDIVDFRTGGTAAYAPVRPSVRFAAGD